MSFNDKELKNMLKDAFEAPAPERKKEFLRNIRTSKKSNLSFMMSQVFYIRKPVWILSVLIIAGLIFISRYLDRNILWAITACMPFVAMIAVSENTRSNTYNMTELEMTTRFSLKSVVFARMGIIGIFHLVLLLALMIFAGQNAAISIVRMGVYLLVPYMLTTVVSLSVARKFRGAEVNYICMGVAVIVCALDMALKSMVPVVCSREHFVYWVLALAIIAAFMVVGFLKKIFWMEEALWN